MKKNTQTQNPNKKKNHKNQTQPKNQMLLLKISYYPLASAEEKKVTHTNKLQGLTSSPGANILRHSHLNFTTYLPLK